jgi:hypothetical protein
MPRKVVGFEPQSIPPPHEGVDERNGWREPGEGDVGYQERGNPLCAFDREERISLCSDELGRLFQWMLFGGSSRNRKRTGAVNLKLKGVCERRDFGKMLRRPSIIGYRVLAMLMRIRPDLLQGMRSVDLARVLRISERMMALYTLSFADNFPIGSKTIRRTSRQLNEEIKRARKAK